MSEYSEEGDGDAPYEALSVTSAVSGKSALSGKSAVSGKYALPKYADSIKPALAPAPPAAVPPSRPPSVAPPPSRPPSVAPPPSRPPSVAPPPSQPPPPSSDKPPPKSVKLPPESLPESPSRWKMFPVSIFCRIFWLIVLLIIGWPISILFGFIYGVFAPLFTLFGLDDFSEILKGVNIGRICAKNVLAGKTGF